MTHFQKNAKAYAALAGSLITVLLTLVPADSQWHAVLVTLGVLATTVATWRVPNQQKKG